MKKISIIFLILFLILFTALIKNSTKKIDDEIFVIQENLRGLKREFENVKLALVLPEQHPAHFAVERDDADSFGKLKLHRDETQSVYIEDPWTNNVEILQINKNE